MGYYQYHITGSRSRVCRWEWRQTGLQVPTNYRYYWLRYTATGTYTLLQYQDTNIQSNFSAVPRKGLSHVHSESGVASF